MNKQFELCPSRPAQLGLNLIANGNKARNIIWRYLSKRTAPFDPTAKSGRESKLMSREVWLMDSPKYFNPDCTSEAEIFYQEMERKRKRHSRYNPIFYYTFNYLCCVSLVDLHFSLKNGDNVCLSLFMLISSTLIQFLSFSHIPEIWFCWFHYSSHGICRHFLDHRSLEVLRLLNH